MRPNNTPHGTRVRAHRFIDSRAARASERGRSAANNGRRKNGARRSHTNFTIAHEREWDGRWIAEVPELPGVLAHSSTSEEAMVKAEALALRVLAERPENNEMAPQPISTGIAAGA